MRKIVFSFLVFFSSIVYGQSGFNPPKTTITQPLTVESIGIDTVRVLDSVRVYFDQSQQILDTSNMAILLLILDSLSEGNKVQRDSFNSIVNELKTINDSIISTIDALKIEGIKLDDDLKKVLTLEKEL